MDKLTIVAHDRFQEIIDAANRPDSIIRKENIITIDELELGRPKEVITTVSTMEKAMEERQKIIDTIIEPEERTASIILLKP